MKYEHYIMKIQGVLIASPTNETCVQKEKISVYPATELTSS